MPLWKAALDLGAAHLPWAGRWPRQATAEARAEALGLLSPQAVYELVPVTPTPTGPRLPDGAILRCPALGPAGRLLLAVCTIGPALDERCRELSAQGALPRALLLDALGVVALQELGRGLERHVARELAPQGLRLGCLHAPGQDDWPLADQPTLFAHLQPARIGVHLQENCLMVPLKSASVAFPVGRPEELPAGGPACARCERRERCPYAQ